METWRGKSTSTVHLRLAFDRALSKNKRLKSVRYVLSERAATDQSARNIFFPSFFVWANSTAAMIVQNSAVLYTVTNCYEY